MAKQSDEDLLVECDSWLSLILYREKNCLSQQTVQDLESLMRRLRPRTNEITRQRK